ncbi:MAG: DNA-processing protein DprA [Fimbriimonadaceae bacterium]|nr:DNA-processing protein DprA [Fimbriimonadaceae bacterium]
MRNVECRPSGLATPEPNRATAAWSPASVLAALYLPGYPGPVPAPSRWPAVANAIRASAPDGCRDLSERLRRGGLSMEAFLLEDEARRRWAQRALDAGGALTAMDEAYPRTWLARLGSAAPPALWVEPRTDAGPLRPPRLPGWIGVVGSRSPHEADLRFAAGVAREAHRLGFGVVSGGAPGVDRAAIRGAGLAADTLEVLPCGIAVARVNGFGSAARWSASIAAPTAAFAGAMAMRRNVLVYGLGVATVVVRARFKMGGTWNGALEARRRRLGPILVQRDEGDLAHRALVALGAVPVETPEALEEALRAAPRQPSLFSSLG